MSLAPERWKQIEGLFQAATDLPAHLTPKERAEWLATACGEDLELLQEVTSLLHASTGASTGLHNAVAEAADEAMQDTQTIYANLQAGDDTGLRIGAFELVREIGRGGMGTVYLGKRVGGEFEQLVAIKLVNIAPSARSDETLSVMDRFRSERRILAALEHPNIAKLMDGGSAPDGRPYFVMEYVHGTTVTGYCEQKNLDLKARLHLFLDICSAVEHAHQRMIIHRDIKPANILVKDGPAGPMAKLLDFGIAKIIDPGSSHHPDLTEAGMRLLTPDYASPEQIRAEPVSAATDVYALGAVLFELLTATKAHNVSSHSALEIERAICTVEITPPSSAGGKLPLDADLDNIVLTAMRKEQGRRYQSVAALADDIRRYISGRPVLARADSLVYRAGKFIKRNRIAVGSAVLLGIAVAAGIVSTLHQARRAEARFQQVRTLAKKFLFDFDDKIAPVPGNVAAREMLVKTGLEYLDSLAAEASGDLDLQAELAAAYERVANIQGQPGYPNLGHQEQAVKSYHKAVFIQRHLVASRPGLVADKRALARTLVRLGRTLLFLDQQKEAEAAIREALPLAKQIMNSTAATPEEAAKNCGPMISVSEALGRIQRNHGDLNGALATFRENLAVIRKVAKLVPSRRSLSDIGLELTIIGSTAATAGQLRAAKDAFQEAEDLYKKLLQSNPNDTLLTKDLGNVYFYRANVYTAWPASQEERKFAVEDWGACTKMALDRFEADRNNADARYDAVNNSLQFALLLAARDPGKALSYLRTAETLVAGQDLQSIKWQDIPAALELARAVTTNGEIARKHFEKSIAMLTQSLQDRPSLDSTVLIDARMRYGAFLKGKDTPGAITHFMAVLDLCETPNPTFAAQALKARAYRELWLSTKDPQWKAKEQSLWQNWMKTHPAEPYVTAQAAALE